jgi:hypothetical protein
MSAIAAGQLVKSHMKYNRSSKDITKLVTWAGLTQHNNKLAEGTNASNKDKKRPKREYYWWWPWVNKKNYDWHLFKNISS